MHIFGHSAPIYIKKLVPGGSALLSGQLQVNDIILQVNNKNLDQMTYRVSCTLLLMHLDFNQRKSRAVFKLKDAQQFICTDGVLWALFKQRTIFTVVSAALGFKASFDDIKVSLIPCFSPSFTSMLQYENTLDIHGFRCVHI